MRDIGTIVWVVLIAIGVVSSMVKSVRRQAGTAGLAASRGPRPVQAGVPLPELAQPIETAQRAVPAPQERRRPVPAAQAAPPAAAAQPRRRLFDGRSELVRAVIAAEVLGKPRALSDEYTIR